MSQIPKIPPTVLEITAEKEKALAPQRRGIKLPVVVPMINPNQIRVFGFIQYYDSSK